MSNQRKTTGLVLIAGVLLWMFSSCNAVPTTPSCNPDTTLCATFTPSAIPTTGEPSAQPPASTPTSTAESTEVIPTLTASPTVDPTPTQIASEEIPDDALNLLDNPGFEDGAGTYPKEYLNQGTIEVPPGWNFHVCHPPYMPSHCPAARQGEGNPVGLLMGLPETHPLQTNPDIANRIHSGDWSFKAFEFYRVGRYGLYQIVDVTPGWVYEFSGWFQVWSASEDIGCWAWLEDRSGQICGKHKSDAITIDQQQNTTILFRFEVTGGDIVYTESAITTAFNAYSFNCLDQWCQLSAQVTAQTNKLTVSWECFHVFPVKHNDCYVDDFALRGVSPSEGE